MTDFAPQGDEFAHELREVAKMAQGLNSYITDANRLAQDETVRPTYPAFAALKLTILPLAASQRAMRGLLRLSRKVMRGMDFSSWEVFQHSIRR